MDTGRLLPTDPGFARALLGHLPDGSVNVFDRDLRYLLAEGRGLATVGLSPEMLVGRTLAEVFPPESVAAVLPHYRAAFAGARVAFDLEVGGRVFQISAGPLPSGVGGAEAIIAVAQDVTARATAEAAVAASERRFRALVEHGWEGIWLLAGDGTVLYQSPPAARILGS